MPEAAVDEDCDSLRREDEIRSPTQIRKRASVDEVAETPSVHGSAHGELRGGVLPTLPLHAQPSGVGRSERRRGYRRRARRGLGGAVRRFDVIPPPYRGNHARRDRPATPSRAIQLSLLSGAGSAGGASRSVQTDRVSVGSVVSLFSGAGGLDLGIEAAGFETRVAVEWDEDAADTMEKNANEFFPGLREVVRGDLYPMATGSDDGLTTKDILQAGGFRARERPDLLIGGPPCVAFSKSGFWLDWKRDGADPAASLLQAYTRVLAEAEAPPLHPRERLRAHLQQQGEQAGVRASSQGDRGRGLPVQVAGPERRRLRSAPGSASPLHRRRREGRDASRASRADAPRRVGTPQDRRRSAPARHQQARRSTGVIAPAEPGEDVNGRWGHLLPEIPPGENYLHFTAERGHPDPIFEWRSRYWSFLLKLDPDRPAPTIQAQPGPNVGPFHWENRRLRVPGASAAVHVPGSVRLRRPARLRAVADRELGSSAARPACRRDARRGSGLR